MVAFTLLNPNTAFLPKQPCYPSGMKTQTSQNDERFSGTEVILVIVVLVAAAASAASSAAIVTYHIFAHLQSCRFGHLC